MIPTKVAQLAVFTCAKSAPSHENNRNEKKHPPYNKKFAAVMRKFTASFGINVRRRMRLSSYNLTQARNMINKNQQQTGMNFWNRASFVTFFSPEAYKDRRIKNIHRPTVRWNFLDPCQNPKLLSYSNPTTASEVLDCSRIPVQLLWEESVRWSWRSKHIWPSSKQSVQHCFLNLDLGRCWCHRMKFAASAMPACSVAQSSFFSCHSSPFLHPTLLDNQFMGSYPKKQVSKHVFTT